MSLWTHSESTLHGLKLRSEFDYIFRKGESVAEDLVHCAERKECSVNGSDQKVKDV